MSLFQRPEGCASGTARPLSYIARVPPGTPLRPSQHSATRSSPFALPGSDDLYPAALPRSVSSSEEKKQKSRLISMLVPCSSFSNVRNLSSHKSRPPISSQILMIHQISGGKFRSLGYPTHQSQYPRQSLRIRAVSMFSPCASITNTQLTA